MDENNYDEGMFGGADLEKGQETVKEVGATATRAGVDAGKKVAGKGKDIASGIKDKITGSQSNNKGSSGSGKKKKRIVGPDKKIKGKFYAAKGELEKAKGRSLKAAGAATHATGTAARGTALAIKGAATLVGLIPYVGPVLSTALQTAATAVDQAGVRMQQSGKKMTKAGKEAVKKGKHDVKRGKTLSKKGVDIGDASAHIPGISSPQDANVPSVSSVISKAKRNKLSIIRIIAAMPFVKWILLGVALFFLFMACFSSSSREHEGAYDDGNDGNVPYSVSKHVTSKLRITSDGNGGLTYGFEDENGNIQNLDGSIDDVLKALKENDSNAYADLGDTDEERKEFLKTLILAELATQYPDLSIKASGDIDMPDTSNQTYLPQADSSMETIRVDELTLDEKIYQLLMIGVTLSDSSAYTDTKVGGVFFFGGSNYNNLTAIGSSSKVTPFVATDDEGGQITRAAPGTPSAKSYGDSQDYEKLRNDEVEKTNLLLAQGINVNLGPVTDAVSSGAIYDAERSYSSDSDVVRKCVDTVIKARQSATVNGRKLGSALKHYPGYPNESANSDFNKCVDNRTASQVNASANTFKEGIRSGAEAVMVSNVVYTNVDSNYPASLSPTIVSDLRNNFNGVIMTDGIDAKATEEYANRYKQAIIAGNDMVLLNESNLDTAFNQIKAAVESGEISEDRINQSVERILTMKRNLGILKNTRIGNNSTTNNNSTSTATSTTTPLASISSDAQGKIKIKRKDESGNVAVLEYKDEATFNSMIASGDPEVMKYYTLKKNVGGATTSTGPADYSGSDNEEIVWNFLRSKGLSEIATAAAMGNIQAESGFDPGVQEYGSGIGFGLAQWSYGRRTQIEQYAADKGKPVSDINTQLDFLWMEMDPNANRSGYANLQWGGGGYGWDGAAIFSMFTSMTDIQSATTLYCRAFERAGVEALDTRTKNARAIYDRHAGSTVKTAETDNSNSSSSDNSNSESTASAKNLNNFLFIGDSRYNGISESLKKLGRDISVCAVDSSNPSQWVSVTQNKSGTVLGTSITLPDTASGVSVMLGVNETSQVSELKQVLTNLHTNYPSAKIYFNSIYHVSQAYTNIDASTMNANIDAMNAQMKSYCESESWLEYVDVTNNLNDENGYLKNADSAGLHLQGEGQTTLVNNIKATVTGDSSYVDAEESNIVNNSGSEYMLVVASYTTQNTRSVDSYQYSHTQMVSTTSGTSSATTQHSPTPSDTVAQDYTTVNYSKANLDYQAVLKDYTLYFDFLWAMFISSRDKETTLWFANQAINGNIEITLYTENKTTVNTSQAVVDDITRSVLEGTTAFVDYFHTVRTTTVTTQIVKSKACVTLADVWFLKYENNADNYQEYESKSKEVTEEKTTDDSDLIKFLRDEERDELLYSSGYLLERMIENNAKVAHLFDIYTYVLSKSRNSESSYKNVGEIVNLGSFDISTFVPVSSVGTGEGAMGGEEIPEAGEGYSTVFKVGTRTYKNYKQMEGSWCMDSLAGFPGDTLSGCGCAINAITVILTGYGINMTPGEVNNYAKSNSPYESCHGVTLSNLLGKNVTYHNSGDFKKMIIEQLNAGKPCLVRTSAYSSSHYICILAISDDGTQVYVSDVGGNYPGQGRNGWQPLSFLDRINMEIYTIDD